MEETEAPRQIDLHADPSINIVEREVSVTRLADTDSSEEEEVEGDQAWVTYLYGFFYFQVEMHYLQCISPKYWTSIFISNSTQSFVNPTVGTLNVFCITLLSWNLSKGLFQLDFRI